MGHGWMNGGIDRNKDWLGESVIERTVSEGQVLKMDDLCRGE